MTRLRCTRCGNRYEAITTERWRCECTGPLDFESQPAPSGAPPSPGSFDRREGIWAFSSFLPISKHSSLGEGFTPLVYHDDWEAWFKLEYVSPSGSFKDRGAATVVSYAVDRGVSRIVEDSSGNAGLAIAQYAALSGIDAAIYVPEAVSPGKRRSIEGFEATVVAIDGGRDAVADACIDEVSSGTGWYASHVWNPAFLAGTTTFGIEMCAQRDWHAPDAVVIPVGNGTLLLGAYRGFQALHEAGWIDHIPRLLGVQATGIDPIAEHFDGPTTERNRIATGIQVGTPAREHQIIEAISATDGYALAVNASAVTSMHNRLRRAGFLVEPTSAVGPAGLHEYRERGVIDAGSDVVVPLTGSGLKSGDDSRT